MIKGLLERLDRVLDKRYIQAQRRSHPSFPTERDSDLIPSSDEKAWLARLQQVQNLARIDAYAGEDYKFAHPWSVLRRRRALRIIQQTRGAFNAMDPSREETITYQCAQLVSSVFERDRRDNWG